mmetsp:Transcript_20775/g.57437  ORF Transcript_20775/g.57437 Transcript_20775/m.57437 type:complete len:482 (+) Transcript_20775:211-1656(+)
MSDRWEDVADRLADENGEVVKKKKKKKKKPPVEEIDDDAPKKKKKQPKKDIEEDDDDDDDEHNALLGDVMQEWAGGTSVHGAALASDRQTYSLWFRLCWMVVVVFGCAVMMWQIQALISQYRNFDVSTDTEIVVPDSIEFPEITICNTNPFSARLQGNQSIVDPVNEEEFKALQPRIDDFIWATFFNEQEINVTEETWKPVITDAGYCYQFNTDNVVSRPGVFGGLEVWTYLDQDDYANGTDLAAVNVFILQKGTKINEQLPFVPVSPGGETIISVKKTQFGREKQAPWARCTSKAPEYTQSQCRDDCINHVFSAKCGCRHWGDSNRTEMRFCGYLENEADINCYSDFNDTEALEICQRDGIADCSLPPCEITIYEASSVVADNSQKTLDLYESFWPGLGDEFQQNFIAMRINYDKLQFEVVTQSPSITFATLLGSIGGSMGLFLGISVVSIIEIFGDLLCLRVLPRGCGIRRLYGLGGRR